VKPSHPNLLHSPVHARVRCESFQHVCAHMSKSSLSLIDKSRLSLLHARERTLPCNKFLFVRFHESCTVEASIKLRVLRDKAIMTPYTRHLTDAPCVHVRLHSVSSGSVAAPASRKAAALNIQIDEVGLKRLEGSRSSTHSHLFGTLPLI
jgi:hypothetical protein